MKPLVYYVLWVSDTTHLRNLSVRWDCPSLEGSQCVYNGTKVEPDGSNGIIHLRDLSVRWDCPSLEGSQCVYNGTKVEPDGPNGIIHIEICHFGGIDLAWKDRSVCIMAQRLSLTGLTVGRASKCLPGLRPKPPSAYWTMPMYYTCVVSLPRCLQFC